MENLIKLGYAEFYVLGGDGPLCHGSARRLAEIDCNLVFVCLVRLVPCLFFFLTCLRGWMRLTSLLGRVRCGRGKSFRYSFLAGADNVNCFLHRDGLIKVKDLKDSELLSKIK